MNLHTNFTIDFSMQLSSSKQCNTSTTKMIEKKIKTRLPAIFKIENMHMSCYTNNLQKITNVWHKATVDNSACVLVSSMYTHLNC